MSQPRFRRGDVYWVRFPAGIGSEIQKTRPAIIVSNDISNRMVSRLQVVPVTTNTARIYPGEALVTVSGSRNKAMANQIQSVSTERVGRFVGRISTSDTEAVNDALRTQLGLEKESHVR